MGNLKDFLKVLAVFGITIILASSLVFSVAYFNKNVYTDEIYHVNTYEILDKKIFRGTSTVVGGAVIKGEDTYYINVKDESSREGKLSVPRKIYEQATVGRKLIEGNDTAINKITKKRSIVRTTYFVQ